MNKQNKGNMLSWLVMALVGVLVIILRKQVEKVLYIVAGAGLMLMAVISVISSIKGKSGRKSDLVQIILSALLFAVGIWILFNPTAFGKLLNVVIGLVLIGAGAMWCFKGIKAKDIFTIVLGGIAVIFGIVVAVNSSATSGIIIAAGIGLIYTAVSGIISELRLK